jgi:hypothetical protein
MRTRIAAALVFSLCAFQSHALLLTPSTSGVIAGLGYGPSNCEPECVETVFGVDDLTLLYKADVGSPVLEEGTFAASYSTVFTNTALDPSGATISYVPELPSILCGDCFLAIKDGRSSPGYYFYNLSAWDGIETITLADFWPQQGAISHVSIWGGESVSVPEPATLGLLGAGLLLVGLRKRKQLIR